MEVSASIPVLFLCSTLEQAEVVLGVVEAFPNTYAMVGSPVITADLHRAGLRAARRFVCFADDELQRSSLERYVVDFTSISAHIATSNALGGDWETIEEKVRVEFVFQ